MNNLGHFQQCKHWKESMSGIIGDCTIAKGECSHRPKMLGVCNEHQFAKITVVTSPNFGCILFEGGEI